MKQRRIIELNALALAAGASWALVREGKHLVIDWTASGRTVRRVMSATPSDRRALANVVADLRRAFRRWLNQEAVAFARRRNKRVAR